MTGLKCPFCNNEITGTETTCSKCGHDLIIQCPYCKQSISAFEEVCPCCSTRLRKRNYNIWFYRAGVILSTLWLIMMSVVTYLYIKFPEILKYEDKRGHNGIDLYLTLCFKVILIACIPYVISIVQKTKLPQAITGLVVNLLVAVGLAIYMIHMNALIQVQ